jgi:hypothetical protein
VSDPNEVKVREWRNKLQKAFLGKSGLAESVSVLVPAYVARSIDYSPLCCICRRPRSTMTCLRKSRILRCGPNGSR